MATLTLRRHLASYLVDVALAAASRDDVTPVICGAHVTVEDGRVRIVATDRFRVHAAIVDAVDADDDFEAIIPRDALLWLKKNGSYYGSSGREGQRVTMLVGKHRDGIRLQKEAGVLQITVAQSDAPDAPSIQWNGTHIYGNYPPVIKLIEEARQAESVAATPLLNMSFVGAARAISPDHLARVRMKFTAGKNADKPGPVYFSAEDGIDITAEALLQPHVESRSI